MATYQKIRITSRITDDNMVGTNFTGGDLDLGEITNAIADSGGWLRFSQASGAAAENIYPANQSGKVNFLVIAKFDINELAAGKKYTAVRDTTETVVSAGQFLACDATASLTIQTNTSSSVTIYYQWWILA